jgi:succinate dehydrogenase / fumarate reductase membrane anchor subunit
MAMQTPIARVRGLGAAREGLHHWKAQRVTAVANLVLILWFVFSAAVLAGADYAEVRAWLASPVAASLMILLVISVFHHARLGLLVVIEDYVHHGAVKVVAISALILITAAVATACIVAVLQVSIGS